MTLLVHIYTRVGQLIGLEKLVVEDEPPDPVCSRCKNYQQWHPSYTCINNRY